MTGDEAYLMVRMQLALVMEGLLHHPPAPAGAGWTGDDDVIIRRAVRTAWPRIKPRDRHTLRYWAPGPGGQ